MPKWAKKALDITTTVALVVFIIFVILLVGVRVFGIEPHIVLSGSMEPEILTGSMVYVDKLTPEEAQNLEPGDTVTYQVDQRGTKVTHKIYNVVGPIPIYELDENGSPKLDGNGNPIVTDYTKDAEGNVIVMYTTYGVNNVHDGNVELALDGDPEVGNLASSNVIGEAMFSIPYLGYIAHFVQNPPGKYLVIIGCVMLIFMTFFVNDPQEKEKVQSDAAEPQVQSAECGVQSEESDTSSTAITRTPKLALARFWESRGGPPSPAGEGEGIQSEESDTSSTARSSNKPSTSGGSEGVQSDTPDKSGENDN